MSQYFMNKNKAKTSAHAVAPGEVSEELVSQALELDPQGEDFGRFLSQLQEMSAAQVSQLASSLAREGQERAVPILMAMTILETAAPAAAEALGMIRSQEAANQLLQLTDSGSTKEVKKAAGRALHRLRSLGFRPEASPAPAPTQTPQTAPARRPSSRAWASSIDGAGSRFLFITVPEPLGGHLNLVFLMLNDSDGIRETRVGHAGDHDEASSRVETVARESGLPHVEIPAEYARHLIRESKEKASAAGHPLPVDYMVWREAIGDPEEAWERPPIYQELNAAQILMEPGLLEESARLLDLKEFWNWRLDTEQMRPYAQDLEQAKRGSIVLPEAAQAEREERVLEKALNDLLQDDGRARYRRRFEEMSYVLLHSGREREARSAFAAALAMEQEAQHSGLYLPGSRATDFMLGDRSPFARHPFFRRLLVESLNRALDQISRGRKLIVAG